MTGKSEWEGRVGSSWASEWRRTDRAFGELTPRLLADIRQRAGSRVLDIGCGAGELSLAIGRERSAASVHGIDISEALIEAARTRGANMPNASFECTDAATWQPAASAPDLMVSRHGVMFFDDPVAAFRHLANIAAPGASLVFSCFRSRSQCPFFTEIDAIVGASPTPEQPMTYQPGPFGFSDANLVQDILADAGWTEIELVPHDFAMVAGAGPDPVEDALAYFRRIGPAASVMAEASPEERSRIETGIRAFAERHLHGGIVAARAAAWIVKARKQA
ncbi:class I SAM-dependent methyltransferase [Paraurantiacibacter namhicola]|uniref:Demethylmenaquinone methyltransferase n=1 Tax=Paraurantiacibacter namhicola TaxID=645517 RepID=A0A1C7D898_9SPHN|nr:class I SAM-dependent methyltransferase [Paraurantiacibacter namhicola]ANU07699.1 Demethylmenaquinone methyltransferase [Paraurantiacibacter namhicola]